MRAAHDKMLRARKRLRANRLAARAARIHPVEAVCKPKKPTEWVVPTRPDHPPGRVVSTKTVNDLKKGIQAIGS